MENKGVQRSSSWKHQRPASERFNRNSERRKTVLPVVRPIPKYVDSSSTLSVSLDDSNLEKAMQSKTPIFVVEKEGEANDKSEITVQGHDGDVEADVKVIKIAGEAVELEEGKVKKHQKGRDLV